MRALFQFQPSQPANHFQILRQVQVEPEAVGMENFQPGPSLCYASAVALEGTGTIAILDQTGRVDKESIGSVEPPVG